MSVTVKSCDGKVGVGVKFKHVARDKLRAVGVATEDDAETVVESALEGGREDVWERVRLIAAAELIPLGPFLVHAACDGDCGAVEKLLECGADAHDVADVFVDESNEDDEVTNGAIKFTPLSGASYHGCLEVVELLLKRGVDANALECGSTALIRAVTVGCVEVIKVLLVHGALAELLVSHGADPNGANDAPPLVISADRGHLGVLSVLLAHGARADTYDSSGSCALARAAARGRPDVVEALLAHRVGVGACDKMGWSALHYAAKAGSVAAVEVLLAHGADVDAVDTPDAACGGDAATATALMETCRGRTPLMLACREGHVGVVQMLLARRARADVQDSAGATALIEAAAGGHLAVAALLVMRLPRGAPRSRRNLNALHGAGMA